VPTIRIEDAHDPRLADYRGVREPAWLVDRGLLIAEGRFVVRRLLADRRVRFRSLLLNNAACQALAGAIERDAPDVDVYVASPAVIEGATGFNIHRGCLALADRPDEVPLETALAMSDRVVVLERVVDADNVGSVFRNAEAFGAGAVLLSPGCADPLYRKALRTSSGAALMVPFAAAAPWPSALEAVGRAGFLVVAMTPDEQARDIGDFVATPAAAGRIALLFGTEGAGLTPDAIARTGVRVRIPIGRTLDSLNIATAAGIALHRFEEASRGAALPPHSARARIGVAHDS
jgi:tRNA G18 (ribose-2'-O)-methylase SpoU